MAQNEKQECPVAKWYEPPARKPRSPLESGYQSRLRKKLLKRYNGCQVMKTDATVDQGIPDLLIVYGSKRAYLECKRSPNARFRPNQKARIEALNSICFARAINPQNEGEVLYDLDIYFGGTNHG